jgi:hypothetical protein
VITVYRIYRGLVDELTGFGGAVGAGGKFFPVDLNAGGVDDALGRGGNFGTDAFAGNQRDFVSHMRIVLYAMGLCLSKGAGSRVARQERSFVRRK